MCSVGAFPDRTSCLRLVTAVVGQQTKQWIYRPHLNTSVFQTSPARESSAQLPPNPLEQYFFNYTNFET